jgi:hypothetical protein
MAGRSARSGAGSQPSGIAPSQSLGSRLPLRMRRSQQTDPFTFLIYAEFAGAEIGPVE